MGWFSKVAFGAAMAAVGAGAATLWQGREGGPGKDGKSRVLDAGPLAPPGEIVAEALVTPVQFASLSLPMGGRITEILVAEGGPVKAGQVVARIDTRDLQARLAAARAEVGRAQALLREVKAPLRPEDIEVRRARIAQVRVDEDRARAELARTEALKARGAVTDAELDRAKAAAAAGEAARKAAEAELKLLEAGARTESVAVVEAQVQSARAAVLQVEAALAQAEMRAPIDGVVAALDLRLGEYAPPGFVGIRIADISRFVLKTDDLTELAVVRVKDNAQVHVTLDAIPGLELTGHVTQIRALGEMKKGDMTYTATVELDQQDPRLRWNMTAAVRIGAGVADVSVRPPG